MKRSKKVKYRLEVIAKRIVIKFYLAVELMQLNKDNLI